MLGPNSSGAGAAGGGRVGVLNYGAGNLGSVMNALERLGVEAAFVGGPEELALSGSPYSRLLFPGDGHFGTTMAALEKAAYAEALRRWIGAERPFLGICIGLQVLFESSEEAPGVAGLGVIPGTVKRFSAPKVPQIGWNSTSIAESSRLFKGTSQDTFFYYIHSYYVVPEDPSLVAARADYSGEYCAAVEWGGGRLAATQFHPEKSGEAGLALLSRWLSL
jgi:imidazole glycerol phosphate synthase glutamine amidotransferase subunit